MNKRQKITLAVMIPIILAAIVFSIWPLIRGSQLDQTQQDTVALFYEQNPYVSKNPDPSVTVRTLGTEDDGEFPYPDLYAAMQQYNAELFLDQQTRLGDAWSYTVSDFNLWSYGVDSEVVGVVDIPSLNISMPLYLGATYDHMAAGCAQLADTSMPIGGINTNCVIAGHCGWGGADYFRYLSTIEDGAYVYVTNLWETMVYRVVEKKIIYPYDLDQIKIQEDKDLITLFTCHPYASGGKYRFVVYCERVLPDELIANERSERMQINQTVRLSGLESQQ